MLWFICLFYVFAFLRSYVLSGSTWRLLFTLRYSAAWFLSAKIGTFLQLYKFARHFFRPNSKNYVTGCSHHKESFPTASWKFSQWSVTVFPLRHESFPNEAWQFSRCIGKTFPMKCDCLREKAWGYGWQGASIWGSRTRASLWVFGILLSYCHVFF